MTEVQAEQGVVIKCDDIHLSFGAVQAVDGVSLNARDTEIVAVIGPNGAGKTCLLNCINGFHHPLNYLTNC